MLSTTFCLGKVATATAAAQEHEISLPDPQISQRLLAPPALVSLTGSSHSQGPPPRSNILRSRTAGSGNSNSFTVLNVPLSQMDNHNPMWSANASTAHDFPTLGGKRSLVASKTSFQLAHPPPVVKHRQRFNIRPQILLQLQQISDATRPLPAFDVVLSTVFAPKFARKFPSIFRRKDGLGVDDLVVVNSQSYGSPYDLKGQTDSISDEDSWDAREVVAAICQSKKKATGVDDLTEICLNHGAVWEASPLSTGAYEFASVDERGNRIVARWVPRPRMIRRRTYNGQDSAGFPIAEQRRFIFSIVNPDSRRHPVIATLSRSTIDISDQYPVPSAMSRPQSLTSTPKQESWASESSNVSFNGTESSKMVMMETDERLRSLIITTGIWVAFREGFSSNFHYEKPVGSTAPSINPGPCHKARSRSVNMTSIGKARGSTSESLKREHILRMQPTPENFPSTLPAVSSPPILPSTGAAFLQRANSRRPDLSKKPFQAGSIIASTPVSLAKTPGAQPVPKLSSGNWTSARVLNAKPTAFQKRDAWNQDSVHDLIIVTPPGSAATKPTKMNKLFGLIKRTSGAR